MSDQTSNGPSQPAAGTTVSPLASAAALRPRSASVGRLARVGAPYMLGSALRPTSANVTAGDWGTSTAPRDVGQASRRLVATPRTSGAAWGRDSRTTNTLVRTPKLPRAGSDEAAGSDMISQGTNVLREQLQRARDEAKAAVAERKRAEGELLIVKGTLEGLIYSRERVALAGPITAGLGSAAPRDAEWTCGQCGNSNLARRLVCNLCQAPKPGAAGGIQRRISSDSAASVAAVVAAPPTAVAAATAAAAASVAAATATATAALSELNQELRDQRDALAAQLAALQKSTRSARVAELEAEVKRLKASSAGAPSSSVGADADAANGSSGGGAMPDILDITTVRLPVGANSISAAGVRRSLQAMHQAHKMLMAQATLIRTAFPAGLAMREFKEKARQRAGTAGAPDVLNFLRNHMLKLAAELHNYPGAPADGRPGSPPDGRAASPNITASLVDAASRLARRLRALDASAWAANVELQSSCSAASDAMAAASSELARLQGLAATAAGTAAGAPAAAAAAGAAAAAPAAAAPALVPFTLTLRTSDVSGGAFAGSVYVVLNGASGATTEVRLPSDSDSFCAGKEDVFAISAEDVGAVGSLSLRMEVAAGPVADNTWHLDSIRVQSTKAAGGAGVDARFVYEGWVPATGSSATLFPRADDGASAFYEVAVYTADSSGAGTDGRVSVRLVGDLGTSAWLELDPAASAAAAGGGASGFARGAVDTFSLTAADVNDLSHVLVRLASGPTDKQPGHSDWNLARVEVLHKGTGWKSVFYCNDWVARGGAPSLLLEADTWQAQVKYTLTVHTSDLKGAEFEGRAFVTLTGYWGSTKEIQLAHPGKPVHSFERDATEAFEVTGDDVGPLTNITVRVETGDDISDAWALDTIDVACPGNDWYGGKFTYDSWLSASVPSANIWKYRDVADYKVSVFTSSDAPYSSFDGDVYLILTGAYGTTDELLLSNDSSVEGPPGLPKTLYTGTSHQEFAVKATNVGNLTSVKVRIQATGTTSSWLLDRIEIVPPPDQANASSGDASSGAPAAPVAAGKACTFNLKGWVYPESAATLPKQLSIVEYKVKVTTSDCSENFDGDVYLTLTGMDGTSDEQKLTGAATGAFSASAVTEFSIKAGDVGAISSVAVRMDATGSITYWSLAKVEVTNVPTKVVSYFRYNGWLNLYWNSSVTLSSQSLFEYQVAVFVADSDPGTFDGDVYVQLQGNYSSDWIKVPPSSGTTYSSKAPATVTLKLSDIGSPYRADVKVEPRAGSSAVSLKLDRVENTNVTTGAVVVFPNPGKGPVGGDAGIAYLSQVNMLWHTATIVTSVGDFSGAAYITLVCDNGETDEQQLVEDDGGAPTFTSAEQKWLSFKTYDLGKVNGVKVRCVGRWNLDRVKLYSHTGSWETFTYYCGKQLHSNQATLEKLDNIDYVVTISSDDVRGNGTDGAVYVTLVGARGASDEMRLYPDNSDTAFERGSTDTITLTTTDVGALNAVRLKLSAPGWGSSPLHAGLRVNEVTVLQSSSGSLVHFPLDGWLDKADEAVTITAGDAEQVFNDYRIAIVGTYSTLTEWSYDARIKIKGDTCTSRLLRLTSSQAQTDANSYTCVYTTGAMDVGSLASIEFTLGDESSSSYMSIARVEVLNTVTQAYAVFPINQYVYSWNGFSSFDKAPADTTYSVEVETAALTGAQAFGGNVWLTVHGDAANSAECKLENWWSSGFQPGSRSTFYITSVNVGIVQAVTVRTEAPDPLPSDPAALQWGLASLAVCNCTNSSQAVCEWTQGYVKAGARFRIERNKDAIDYEVTFCTGDVRGAGTDGTVSVQIGGSSGSSDWTSLDSSSALSNDKASLFARGATDRFALAGAPDVGQGRWLSVRLSGDSVHSSWYLATVELLNKRSGLKSTFNYNNWVSPGCETGQLTEASSVETLVPYTINVKTSDLRGSDFEGEAFIKLNGYDGCTDWIKLVQPGHTRSSFIRAETQSLTLNGAETGYIYSVEVKIVPNDVDPNWNLDEVVVQKAGGEECKFQCGKWLDADNPSACLTRWQDTVNYRIVAYTSAAGSASSDALAVFDGRAFITLVGAWGSCSETELVNDTTTGFAPGVPQVFAVEANSVGNLQSATLRTAVGASGNTTSWILDCLEVSKVDSSDPPVVLKAAPTASSAPSTTAGAPDQPVAPAPVTLVPGADAVTLQKDRPIKEYKVTVVTADAADSAFDGDVYVTLSGNDGTSDEIKLSNASSASANFAVSASSDFTLRLPDYAGMCYIMVRADFTGATTNWNLARIEVAGVADGSKTVFNYNSYLNKDYLSTCLYPQTSYTCKVVVRTADADAAGGASSSPDFNGKVFVTLSTSWDKSAEAVLVSLEPAGFQAGKTQEFTIKSSIGYCYDVALRIEPLAGGAQRWLPDSVEVSFEESGCRQWAQNSAKTWLTKEAPLLSLSTVWMSSYSLTLETSVQSDPFAGSLFLTLVNTDTGVASNEVPLALGDDPLRAGAVTTIDSLSLAGITYNAVRLRAAPAPGSSSPGGSSWYPGTLNLSGQLFTFSGPISVPGTGTGSLLPNADFAFKVYAGDVPGNGTDGDLSVVLLYLSGSTDLEPGQQSSSTVGMPDVGALQELRLWLRDGGSGTVHSQLYVDSVEVTHTPSGMMTTFPVGAWVSRSDDPTVVPAAGDPTDVYVDYVFSVYTTAGSTPFDGEVQVKVEGADGMGDTGTLTLGTGGTDSGLFQAGACDMFVQRSRDVGAPVKLSVNINCRGNCSSWALSRIEVTNSGTGDTKVFLWLDSLYTWSWLTQIPEIPTVTYQVSADTANHSAKDFDGDVYLTLTGENGTTQEVQLSPSDGCFAPNATDVFSVCAADVGRLAEASVRVDDGSVTGSNGAAKWALVCLNVTNTSSGLQAVFECSDASPLGAGDSVTMQKTLVNVTYQVTIRTADARGAGTDGRVYLTLSGDQGVTDEVLATADPSNLQRGCSFDFSFTGLEVGGARTATLRLAGQDDGSGGALPLHSGWNLAGIDVLNMSTGLKGTFNCNAWLAMGGGSGGSVTLEEATAVKALNQYTVAIKTLDQRDADFDGKAYITILGWYAQTAEVPLALPGRSSASFKAGETSSFTLEGVDVGYVRAVAIRMEPTDSDPEWWLDTVAVTSGDSTYSFTYGNRLNKDKPQAEISQSQTLVDWEVLVYTTDLANAGFDGEVAIQMEGLYDYYKSDLVPLESEDESAAAYERGSCKRFKIKAADVGVLTRLHVVATKGSRGPGDQRWHLDKVVVRNLANPDTPVESSFVHRAWVGVADPAAGGGASAGEVLVPKDVPKVGWKVVVVTGDAPNAGLAEGVAVYVALQGSDGKTDEIKLTPELLASAPAPAPAAGGGRAAAAAAPAAPRPFCRGARDVFLMTAPTLGTLSYASVRLEGAGSGTWFLSRLEVTDTSSGATTLLNYKSTLAADSNPTAYLYPQSSYTFTVTVHVSDAAPAGKKGAAPAAFDGDLYIKPSNPWATGEEVKLVNAAAKNFAPGSRSEFTVKLTDLSYVSTLDVRIDATGKVKNLNLDRIDLAMEGGYGGTTYIYKDVLQAPAKATASLTMTYLHDWQVTLNTSLSSEPFDGKLYLTLTGNVDGPGAVTERLALEVTTPDPNAPVGAAAFLPGGTVVCSLRAPAVGTVQKAVLEVEFPSGEKKPKPWTLGTMSMYNTTDGTQLAFFVEQTLTAAAPSATLVPRVDEDYQIIVTTGDAPGAGTDGAVYATLVGAKGDTGELALASADGGDAARLFEHAAVDSFVVSAKELGDLKELRLRLTDDGSGVHSQWNVVSVDVLNRRTGMQVPFPVGAWLAPEDTKAVAPGGKPKDVYVPYEVVVVTADGDDSAFDGDVSVVLKGQGGAKSAPTPLKADAAGAKGAKAKGPFASGATSRFKIRAADVGPLSGLAVVLNASGSSSSWKPKSVEVRLGGAAKGADAKPAVFHSAGDAALYSWYGEQDLELVESK